MKKNNVLITLVTLVIAVAGIGWLLTSRADSTEAVQQERIVEQDRIVHTPINEPVTEKTHPMVIETVVEDERTANTEQQYPHRGGHHTRSDYDDQNRQHCHNGWTE